MNEPDSVMDAAAEVANERSHGTPAFERVSLVLQGGGALGAYQAGVYQAIHEANIKVDWISGTSIGAINGALIAGNPPERRVERLLEFWEAITEPPTAFQTMQWFSDLWAGENGQARSWANKLSALRAMLHGVPNFFSPRPMPPINTSAKRPEDVGYYDAAPLRTTLERLVDFDLINRKAVQLSIGAANVRTGSPVTFDNLDEKITLDHVLASASLPPGFAPTKVEGEYYWDGAVVSNTPMQCVIDSSPSRSELVFQVDLWDSSGDVPLDIPSAYLRATEMHSASRLNISLDQYRKMQRFKQAVCRFLEKLPVEYRDDPEYKALIRQGRVKFATIVQLKYQTRKYETTGKTFEFSRRGMKEHWRAGYDDASAALNEPSVHELPPAAEAARIYDVHRGWLK